MLIIKQKKIIIYNTIHIKIITNYGLIMIRRISLTFFREARFVRSKASVRESSIEKISLSLGLNAVKNI